jgi:hypothetical protein
MEERAGGEIFPDKASFAREIIGSERGSGSQREEAIEVSTKRANTELGRRVRSRLSGDKGL